MFLMFCQNYYAHTVLVIDKLIILTKIMVSMSIGTRIKKIRESKGLSQEELAHKSDVSQSTISSIESSKSMPSALNLYKITKVLEVDLEEILSKSGEMNNSDFKDSAMAVYNQINPTFNISDSELLKNLLQLNSEIVRMLKIQTELIEQNFSRK